MNIYQFKGDLIKQFDNGEFDAIVHGCNCFHLMGGGIAYYLNKYTNGSLLEVDINDSPYGDINKLGSHTVLNHEKGRIYNLYSQYTTSRENCVAVHWDSVFRGLSDIIEIESDSTVVKIGIPLIGCGLANGSIDDFKSVVHDVFSQCFNSNVDLHIIEYDK